MILHERYQSDRHETHVERPTRLMNLYMNLEEMDIFRNLYLIHCPLATVDQVGLVHTKDHIHTVLKTKDEETTPQKMGDPIPYEIDPTGKVVAFNKYTADCSLMAVGAIINSLDVILKDKICRSVFAAVRPPGHHCDNETIAGFCLFNNVAVGVRYA